jgi:hypothetical protein
MTNILEAVYFATAALLLLSLVRFIMSRRAAGEERAVLTEKSRRYFILAGVMGLASVGGYTALDEPAGPAPEVAPALAANAPVVAGAAAATEPAPTASSLTGWTLVPGRGAVGIGPDATHEQLRERLGDSLVIVERVEAGGGAASATVLYPDDPQRRIEVIWRDASRRERPAELRVRGTSSRWRLPSGQTLGDFDASGRPVRELRVPVGG